MLELRILRISCTAPLLGLSSVPVSGPDSSKSFLGLQQQLVFILIPLLIGFQWRSGLLYCLSPSRHRVHDGLNDHASTLEQSVVESLRLVLNAYFSRHSRASHLLVSRLPQFM